MSPSVFFYQREDGVAVVTFDMPGSDVNLLRRDVADELEAVLDRVIKAGTARALLFVSAKPDSFIAGADIQEIWQVRSLADSAQALSMRAQATMQRIADLEIATAAAIDGACLGGGLELALACDLRIASDRRTTKLGLPEVTLGLLPGAGGTGRLPRAMALPGALDMLLTGRSLSANQARQSGLIDAVCPASILTDVAAQMLVARKSKPRDGTGLASRVSHFLTEDNRLSRKVIIDQAKKRVQQRTRGNYPAPGRILDVVQTGLDQGIERGLEAEAQAFGELATTPEAHELMNLFFVRRDLAKEVYWPEGVTPRPVRRIGVIGAGTMGGGIAYVSAAAGMPVRLHDVSKAALSGALRAIGSAADKQVDKGALSSAERDQLMLRVGASTGTRGLQACDLVIEAVVEDLVVKRDVLTELEDIAPEHTIFASNTSAIPIGRLADASRRPAAIIGLHYFSPVPKMPLCEVVVTEHTAPDVVATAVDVARRQGKQVIVVNDHAGFYTTRVLAAYLAEATRLLERGAPIDHIDQALRDVGFAMGPFEVVDSVGIDVAGEIGAFMAAELGPRFSPAQKLSNLIDGDRLGQKNGRGFYDYEHGERKDPARAAYDLLGIEPNPSIISRETAAWRCLLTMVDEAVQARADGVLRSDRDGDAGAVFGLGFPPFLGGPFRFLASRGAAETAALMCRWELAPGPAMLALSGASPGERQ
jgi:3-hydroxyacyl-CoA dehydrogenase / enoyl-CoA hydratase / 3-hydroxybutyryl-CoA epimerase